MLLSSETGCRLEEFWSVKRASQKWPRRPLCSVENGGSWEVEWARGLGTGCWLAHCFLWGDGNGLKLDCGDSCTSPNIWKPSESHILNGLSFMMCEFQATLVIQRKLKWVAPHAPWDRRWGCTLHHGLSGQAERQLHPVGPAVCWSHAFIWANDSQPWGCLVPT